MNGPALLPFQPCERGINPCSFSLQREVVLMVGRELLEVAGSDGIAGTARVRLAIAAVPTQDRRINSPSGKETASFPQCQVWG